MLFVSCCALFMAALFFACQARHTGIKIVQQISILMGCAVLPHLKQLVDVIAPGLQDEQQKVRTIAALAVAALAEAAAPYGIEAFDCVLRPLWKGDPLVVLMLLCVRSCCEEFWFEGNLRLNFFSRVRYYGASG